MSKEMLLRLAWAVGLCVASGATVIVADTWYHGTGKAPDSDLLSARDPAGTAAEIRSGMEALSAAGGVNLRAVKKLTIGIGGSDPKPGGTGLIYIDDIALYRITSRPATRS